MDESPADKPPVQEPTPESPEPERPKTPAERTVAAILADGGFLKVDSAGRLSWSAATGSTERRAAIRDAVRRYQGEIIAYVQARGGALPLGVSGGGL